MFSALSPTVTDSGATKSPVHWSVSMILSILHDHGHERELRSLLCRCWTMLQAGEASQFPPLGAAVTVSVSGGDVACCA